MIVIAHNIRSLHNVGSIYRSCDVFGIDKLYLSGITGTPPRKEIAKVALGSEHRVNWEYIEDIRKLILDLKNQGYEILALENTLKSHSITKYAVNKPVALILGNEVDGIEERILSLADDVLEIQMPGRKQSLNVSVATGIALFALVQKER